MLFLQQHAFLAATLFHSQGYIEKSFLIRLFCRLDILFLPNLFSTFNYHNTKFFSRLLLQIEQGSLISNMMEPGSLFLLPPFYQASYKSSYSPATADSLPIVSSSACSACSKSLLGRPISCFFDRNLSRALLIRGVLLL